jgi:predicted PurR-regulated permease PerM
MPGHALAAHSVTSPDGAAAARATLTPSMNPATWRTIFLVVVGLFVLWLAYLARAVVTPLLVALLLAYILDPVVRFLERRGFSRRVASAAVVIVALALLATAMVVVVTRLGREASVFYDDVVGEPSADVSRKREFTAGLVAAKHDQTQVEAIRTRIRETTWEGRVLVYYDQNGDGEYEPGRAATAMAKISRSLEGTRWGNPFDKALTTLTEVERQLLLQAPVPSAGAPADAAQPPSSPLSGLAKGGETVISAAISLFSLVFLFPIYLFYSLVNLTHVYDVTVKYVPEHQRARVVDILHKIHATLSAFFRGRLITMMVKGLLLLTLFVAFGVPFSYVCAAFAALASLVPVLGGVVAAIPPVVLSLNDASGMQIAGLALGILVIEGFEAYVLLPVLVGRHVGLHPLTVLVCALVAGELLGLFGMIVAIPLTAVAKILAAEFVLPEVRRRAGLPPRAAAAAPPSPREPEG